MSESKDCCRSAWISGVHSADKILKSTIRKARGMFSDREFLQWLDGFVNDETKTDKRRK